VIRVYWGKVGEEEMYGGTEIVKKVLPDGWREYKGGRKDLNFSSESN